ncbi:MAG: hypothetical protein PHD05_00340 [Sphaerochaetaceae bacterium]|nr:hypothetical protein [Sphaerochaetaceae bacterium]
MNINTINFVIRKILQDLVNDGYKKRHICSLTLGLQCEPQFDNFLKGGELGFKPLQRIINNLGYDINIAIVPKNENDITKFINDTNQNFLTESKQPLVGYLNNKSVLNEALITKTGTISEVADKLFEQIINT